MSAFQDCQEGQITQKKTGPPAFSIHSVISVSSVADYNSPNLPPSSHGCGQRAERLAYLIDLFIGVRCADADAYQ